MLEPFGTVTSFRVFVPEDCDPWALLREVQGSGLPIHENDLSEGLRDRVPGVDKLYLSHKLGLDGFPTSALRVVRNLDAATRLLKRGVGEVPEGSVDKLCLTRALMLDMARGISDLLDAHRDKKPDK